jgi:hypothetical protein
MGLVLSNMHVSCFKDVISVLGSMVIYVERTIAIYNLFYLLYFPEENSKQLYLDEILEILDQAKALDPEWHEAMVNANIDIFEKSDEESVSYFKRLENSEKIRRTNGPNPSSLPEDNKK